MPEDATFAVATPGRGLESGRHRFADRVELVVLSDLLGDGLTVVLKDDEGANEIEETARLENAFDGDFQCGVGKKFVAVDGLPGCEALARRGDAADLRFGPIRNDEQFIVMKQARDLGLVRLKLLERGIDGGLRVGHVLELKDGEGKAVDEDDGVRAAFRLAENGELVDGEPVVVRGVVEVDQTDLLAALLAAA